MLQHHLTPKSLLTNTATFPFLANLSASYSQVYSTQETSITGGPVSDDVAKQMTAEVSMLVSNVSVSSSAPPVVSAFVGQQKS